MVNARIMSSATEATNSHDFDRQGEVNEKWTKLTKAPDWTRFQ